jgi:hypothetical protein
VSAEEENEDDSAVQAEAEAQKESVEPVEAEDEIEAKEDETEAVQEAVIAKEEEEVTKAEEDKIKAKEDKIKAVREDVNAEEEEEEIEMEDQIETAPSHEKGKRRRSERHIPQSMTDMSMYPLAVSATLSCLKTTSRSKPAREKIIAAHMDGFILHRNARLCFVHWLDFFASLEADNPQRAQQYTFDSIDDHYLISAFHYESKKAGLRLTTF